MKENRFYYDKAFQLESGDTLPGFELAYATWGNISYDAEGKPNNVVWICHALTSSAMAMDWWAGLVGLDKLFNPEEHFIICANMIGSCYGSTSALSINPQTQEPYYDDFPQLTIRDIVAALDILRESLGITQIQICTGGSMGGQQALEWTIQCPEIFKQLILLATNARHSPWAIAFNEAQRMAIATDSTWKTKQEDAGIQGMKAARAIALLSYRNYQTYQVTQLDEEHPIDFFKASSYQQYQGEKLAKRFNAWAYWYLSKAMDSHNVGRQRGGLAQALGSVQADTLILSIESDILFPPSEQALLAKYIPKAEHQIIHSLYGHDGFLIENEKIDQIIRTWQSSLSIVNEQEPKELG